MEFSDFQFVIPLIGLALLYRNYKTGSLANSYQLKEESGFLNFHTIWYRDKALKKAAHKIEVARVAKIQQSKDGISFFYTSGHAIDIWIMRKEIEQTLAQVTAIIPNAEVIVIKD